MTTPTITPTEALKSLLATWRARIDDYEQEARATKGKQGKSEVALIWSELRICHRELSAALAAPEPEQAGAWRDVLIKKWGDRISDYEQEWRTAKTKLEKEDAAVLSVEIGICLRELKEAAPSTAIAPLPMARLLDSIAELLSIALYDKATDEQLTEIAHAFGHTDMCRCIEIVIKARAILKEFRP